MIYNIELAASSNAVKSHNLSKTVDFSNKSAEKPNCFRNCLKEAFRNKGQNEIKTNDNTVLTENIVCKPGSKYEIKDGENDKPAEENNEEQIDEKENDIKEILFELEKLTERLHMEGIHGDRELAVSEDIKELLNVLAELQIGSITTKNTNLRVKLDEITAMLEKMQQKSEIFAGMTEKEAAADLVKKLKEIAADIPDKITADDNAAEQLKIHTDSIKEFKVNNISAAASSDKESSVLKPYENDKMTAENITGEAAEKQKPALNADEKVHHKVKQVDYEVKQVRHEVEKSEDSEKLALDSKVDKVTVKDEECKRLDTEAEGNKEEAKGTYKAADTAQNKQVNEEATAVNQEQNKFGNKLEVFKNQTPAARGQTVSKTDIINQIVKKAEIIFTDSQSEMKLQLEPENLGKLTLKLSVEKGLITAKFAAESYEVKQIIESNFNELKDLLQEKGLEVQNFSVSVGQENKEYNNSSFQQWKETVKLNRRGMNSAGYEGIFEKDGISLRTANPYSFHEGNFDYRA